MIDLVAVAELVEATIPDQKPNFYMPSNCVCCATVSDGLMVYKIAVAGIIRKKLHSFL